jgi:S1-C subfamily serine protease
MLSRRGLLLSAGSLLFLPSTVAKADETGLTAIRHEIEARVPDVVFTREIASPPKVRGGPTRASLLYRQRVPGVVLISAGDAIGTGAVISHAGDIVTNEHVVRDTYRYQGDELVAVWFKPAVGSRIDKDGFIVARVVRRIVQRDLALIRLSRGLPPSAIVIPIAYEIPEVGQDVFVIGHPLGYFWSLTQGIVSQIRPGHHWQYGDDIGRNATAIQTQAPINPGNSGGPLFDQDGNLIGLVAGGVADAQGLFFAIAGMHIRELLL